MLSPSYPLLTVSARACRHGSLPRAAVLVGNPTALPRSTWGALFVGNPTAARGAHGAGHGPGTVYDWLA